MGKIIIAVLVLAIALVFYGIWYSDSKSVDKSLKIDKMTEENKPTEIEVTKIDNGMTTPATDSSDAAIQSDLDSTDMQINSLDNDQ